MASQRIHLRCRASKTAFGAFLTGDLDLMRSGSRMRRNLRENPKWTPSLPEILEMEKRVDAYLQKSEPKRARISESRRNAKRAAAAVREHLKSTPVNLAAGKKRALEESLF